MQKKLMNYVSIFMVIYAFTTITLMVSYGVDQELIYFDERFSEEGLVMGMSLDTLFSMRQDIEVQTFQSGTMGLSIPIDDLVQESKIHVENDYINQRMIIKLEGNYQDFYEKQTIQDSGDFIHQAHLFTSEEYTYLVLSMNSLKEHVISYKSRILSIKFYDPKELYDQIIVIDPVFGGEEEGYVVEEVLEKEIALEVSLLLKDRLSTTDYKVYYTRTMDDTVSQEARIRLIRESMADFVIRIGVGFEEEEQLYGTTAVYHDNYFIPEFDSVQLSNIIIRNISFKTGTQVLGLQKASEVGDQVVMDSNTPIATINVGCISNPLEREMLKDQRYRNQIASGIMVGITEAFQILEEE
ncbi:MAG: N-acetylmuramoyl-L-alanine amidase [Eubacteriales bacterium]